jgi:hypothetical protein
MLEKVIEFSTQEKYFNLKQDYPQPVKLNIPEWYKKLEHTVHKQTVKGCMPFLDTLTYGYLLRLPQDLVIEIYKDENNNFQGNFTPAAKQAEGVIRKYMLNLNFHNEQHAPRQLEGSPLVIKNYGGSILKIINPWRIKTPKGYSCLFLPPLNNREEDFEILAGIVDTDSFTNEVNFPFILNRDKYPNGFSGILKKGTPYAQIIPFKRDSWKMKIESFSQKESEDSILSYMLNSFNKYKNIFWSKKSCK